MSINTLEKDIEKLKYMIEHSGSKSKKRYYTNILIDLLCLLSDIQNTDIDYEPTGQKISFINKPAIQCQDSIADQICKYSYRNFINELASNSLKHLKPYQDVMFLNETFSIKQAKELILDFFNDYDKNLFPIIKKVIDEEHLFTIWDIQKNTDGFSLFNTFSNNSYIVLYNTDKLTLQHLHCLVHEIGHVINFHYTQANPGYYTKLIYSNMVEVPSTTFEFLFKHYLTENKLYIEDVLKNTNNDLIDFKKYLKRVKIVNRIIHQLPLETEVDTSVIDNLLKQTGMNINNFYDYSCFNNLLLNYNYVYGYIIAIYYLENYVKDKEKTKKDINDFNKNILSYDEFYMLNHFGLNLQKIKEAQHIKRFVKNNQKIKTQDKFYS